MLIMKSGSPENLDKEFIMKVLQIPHTHNDIPALRFGRKTSSLDPAPFRRSRAGTLSEAEGIARGSP